MNRNVYRTLLVIKFIITFEIYKTLKEGELYEQYRWKKINH